MSWCTIESDPGVFNELIERFCVKNVQVEEVYTLDDETVEQLKPVHGLVFLFKWEKGVVEPREGAHFDADAPVFFAKQVRVSLRALSCRAALGAAVAAVQAWD